MGVVLELWVSEGTRTWGFVIGDLGELFVGREEYKIYVCPKCSKIEFFGELKDADFKPRVTDVSG